MNAASNGPIDSRSSPLRAGRAPEAPDAGSPLRRADRPAIGEAWPDPEAAAAWRQELRAYTAEINEQFHILTAWTALEDLPVPDPDAPPLPLAGLTVGVKDIIHARGFETRAGSLLPPTLLVGEEASLVTRLHELGADIVGKTVTTEFAYFEPGPTRNPWHPAYTPGGSSSGSAAGVATGCFDLGLGTQTVGSVIRPAAFCGVCGYKPTFARLPRDGVLLFSETMDHVGLLGRNWDVIIQTAAHTLRDWHPRRPDERPPSDCRLALVKDAYSAQASPAMNAYAQAWSQTLSEAGFAVTEIALFDDIEALNARHQDLIACELYSQHFKWFADFEALYRPRTAELIRKGRDMPTARAMAYRDSGRRLHQKLFKAMADRDIDVLISPAAVSSAPEGLGYTGDPALNLPWTHAGFPTTTLPMGLAPNDRGIPMPVGVQLTATVYRDEMLLHLSREISERLSSLPPRLLL